MASDIQPADLGFFSNTAGASGGAVEVFDSESSFESDTCDFGSDGDGDNNTQPELSDLTDDYEDDQSFTCTNAACE